jgi:hypothetical protein
MTGVRITLDMIFKAARKASEPQVKPVPKGEDLSGWLDDLVQKVEAEAPKAPPAQPPQ